MPLGISTEYIHISKKGGGGGGEKNVEGNWESPSIFSPSPLLFESCHAGYHGYNNNPC